MAKREPLLADLLLNAQDNKLWEGKAHSFRIKLFSMLNDKLRVAKRFVLDDKAITYAARFAMDHPEIVAQCLDFAIQPHKMMWVEFSGEPYANIMDPNHGYAVDRADKRVGILIDNGRFFWASQGTGSPDVLPCSWSLFPFETRGLEYELDEIQRKTTMDFDAIRFLYWGHAAFKIGDYPALEATLYTKYRFDIEGIEAAIADDPDNIDYTYNAHKTVMHYVASSRGDILLAATILLMLNRESNNTVVREVKPQSAIMKNKVRSLVSHSVISFNLTPDPHTYVQTGHSGVWRKEHDVRGHFCTNKRAKTSFCNGAHEWQEVKPHIWQCDRCKGLKWWRKEHKRGNADKGIVTQEYHVTAERKQQ